MRHVILAALGLTLVVPANAGAQQRGRGGQPPDTTRQQDTTRVVREEAAGEVARGIANRGLSRDEVRRLQQALRAAGCEPGAVDGMIGPRTRQAMACARRQRGLGTTNVNELLRALHLDFTVADSLAAPEAERVVAGAEETQPGRLVMAGGRLPLASRGVMRVDLDTLHPDILGPQGVFVEVNPQGRGAYLIETSRVLRRERVVIPADTVRPPARRDTVPAARRDTVAPPARRDSVSTPVRRDTIASDTAKVGRRDTLPGKRADTTAKAKPDTTRGALPDSTLRRMRDEILLMPPPNAARRATPDSLQRDTTRRVPPDSTRRPPPPHR